MLFFTARHAGKMEKPPLKGISFVVFLFILFFVARHAEKKEKPQTNLSGRFLVISFFNPGI